MQLETLAQVAADGRTFSAAPRAAAFRLSRAASLSRRRF